MDNILNYEPVITWIDDVTYVTDTYKEEQFGKSYEDFNTRFPGHHSPSYYKVMLGNYEKYRKAYFNNDIKEMNRIKSFESLLYANRTANLNQDDYLSKNICQIANDELWHKVSDGVKYEDIDFADNWAISRQKTRALYETIRAVFNARYYYYLSYNNLEEIESNRYIEFNNLYVIYKWIVEIVPLLIIIVAIILNYDLINKDIKEGSTKLLITQSIPRWKYYLTKFIAGTIIVVFTIMIPLALSNIYLKTQVKSRPMNYPIVYDEQGLTRFKPSFNYMEQNFEIYEKYEQVAFYKIPYSIMDSQIHYKIPLYQRNTDLIGFDQFLLLVFFYTLLFIMFMVAFIQLCSTIINNVYLSLFATVTIYGGLYYIFKPFLYGEQYNLCPFTMNNAARIVAGTHNVTMLTAFLILTSSILILLFVGIRYFNKKAI